MPIVTQNRARLRAEAAAEAIAEVNRLCGEVRARFVTQIPGQEMVYQRKEEEAGRYLAAALPVLADFPFIKAEVGITGATPRDVAQLYRDMAMQWRQIGAGLETVRLGAVVGIEKAADAAAVVARLAQFRADLAAFVAALPDAG
jgi:hypothetical protein